MAIEKMALVNLVGDLKDLDRSLIKCIQSEYFHPEYIISTSNESRMELVNNENPYSNLLDKLINLCSTLNINLTKTDFDNIYLDDSKAYIDDISEKIDALKGRKNKATENINQFSEAMKMVEHLKGISISLDDIFNCEYVKVRFGKLPVDSFKKLEYYSNKTFFFFPFDHDDEYYWGMYFAPNTKIVVIDNIFHSLFFERMRVPDYAHGTPDKALANIKALLDNTKTELNEITEEFEKIKNEHSQELNAMFSWLKVMNTVSNLKKYVANVNGRFYLSDFIPKASSDEFKELFSHISSIECNIQPHDADPELTPPVKLKNNKFSRPFEAFVNMYSLPSHKDMDPTLLVSITYTLLFGIMFGDLGQGLVIALIGFILAKFKKMDFGKILIRIGFSSAFFGILYGSVFGFEELLDPMYKGLFGLATKPIHVFDTSTTNMLLGGAIGIGALLIVISIIINICLGFKNKDYERAIFGHNGIAGLTLYVSAATAAVSALLFEKSLLTAPYVLGLIVLPILCIFFREPLSKIIKGKKNIKPQNIGEFIIENFFELFEYVLSYLSNSMSFLRVGGFILSHAGMMAVVMSLSEMAGGAASPFVIVIGNIFVMCLEGLIVGIQVLRLEFYEIFSRNFEGNGKPFEPITVSYEINK